MRAVLIATGVRLHTGRSGCRSNLLLPVLDRPVIQHAIERLLRLGVRDFDLMLSVHPHDIEDFIGPGVRWRSTFRFHLVRSPAEAYRHLTNLGLPREREPLWLADASRIPLDGLPVKPTVSLEKPVLALTTSRAMPGSPPVREWTGWALVHPPSLAPLLVQDAPDFRKQFLAWSRTAGQQVDIPEPLIIEGYEDLRRVHERILAKGAAMLLSGGREIAPGVRVSRNAFVHPSATLVAPVFIGADTRIAAGATVGPYTVVGSDCLVSEEAFVANSTVLPRTFVGPALHLHGVVADQGRLIDPQLPAPVEAMDPSLLARVCPGAAKARAGALLFRAAALLLLALGSPYLLWRWAASRLRGQPFSVFHDVVSLPASEASSKWRAFRLRQWPDSARVRPEFSSAPTTRHFLTHVLPALTQVIRGECDLVGVPFRTRVEVELLRETWRTLYLGAKAGLISEEWVRFRGLATPEEQFAADAYYAACQGGRWYDLFLLATYTGHLFYDTLRAPFAPRRSSIRGSRPA